MTLKPLVAAGLYEDATGPSFGQRESNSFDLGICVLISLAARRLLQHQPRFPEKQIQKSCPKASSSPYLSGRPS